jgi:hypothetical protein
LKQENCFESAVLMKNVASLQNPQDFLSQVDNKDNTKNITIFLFRIIVLV